jgi:hypothetical protein
MFCAADDVIEAFPVPDMCGRSQNAIKLMRAERFPAVKNPGQLTVANWGHDGVHVVRHHDKLAELIAHSVKVQKTGFHDSFAIGLRQDAPTVTGIKPTVYGLNEAFMIFPLLAVSVRFRV